MPLSVGTHLGPYEIIAAIGSGGMGEVYRARDAKLGRDVAVKVLPSQFAADTDRMARFQREAQVLAALNHPHIASIYGLEDAGEIRALIMELVDGPTLDYRIAQGPVPLEEALTIARQIAEALETAHDKGIVHRDLKPANIKLTGEGSVKVLDFGLAKAMEGDSISGDAANSPTLTLAATRAGVILGTAAYMSPEQAKGKTVDRRADIWAFGVVLMEMLTGRKMYSGETTPETLAAVIMKEPVFEALPASTPAAIRRLLRRCLTKDPRTRLRDIGEARITIEEVLSGAVSEPAAPTPAVAVARRPLALWIAAAVFLLSTVALAWMHFREAPPPERVLRYTVAPPEKSLVHSFVISPDGHYIAIAAAAGGKRQLWIRSLDALQTQALPGTEGAQYPFWSPDSRYIGFGAQGKLKKIAVNGGPAQVLCDAPDSRGGAWNREGVIVFAPVPTGGLQRVSAMGGVPVQVTKAKVDHRFPIFLPDGRHFLYLVTIDAAEKNGVYLGSVDGKENRRVMADVSSVVYAPPLAGSRDGHLLFVRESTLMAQPFDLKTFQPTSDLFPVAERVPFGTNTSYAQVSTSDTGILVYRSGGALGQTQLVWHDRGGKPLGNVGTPGVIAEFALSPDEKTVAVPRFDPQTQKSDIWLHDLARGTDTRFTFHPSINLAPIWSPKGDRLVFSSDRGGRFDLFWKAASGAGQDELLIPSSTHRNTTCWSRDGKFAVYVELGGKTKQDLWVVQDPMGAAADRKTAVFLQTEFEESQGQLSSDNHWMAYTSDESGRAEVYVRPFPASDGKWKVSTAGGEQPRWGRDGKGLYYLGLDRKLMSVTIKAQAGPKPVFEVSAPEVLFETRVSQIQRPYRPYFYDVTGDGKRFLIATGVGEGTESPLTVVVSWLAGTRK
jgi:Tol biopolymer transport system component